MVMRFGRFKSSYSQERIDARADVVTKAWLGRAIAGELRDLESLKLRKKDCAVVSAVVYDNGGLAPRDSEAFERKYGSFDSADGLAGYLIELRRIFRERVTREWGK